MRYSKSLKLGMLSMAAVMLLCSCRGNDPIQMLESNSVTFEQQETGREEETTACDTVETTTKQEETTTQAQKVIYTVTVGIKDVGALGGVEVYIYGDSSHKNMVKSGTTDYYGSVQFELPKSDKYSIVLYNVPKEYKVSSAYSFNGNNAVITLTTAVIKEPLPSTLKEGDIMYDI